MNNNINTKNFVELSETEINDTNGGSVVAVLIGVVGLGFTLRAAAINKAEEDKQQAYEDLSR